MEKHCGATHKRLKVALIAARRGEMRRELGQQRMLTTRPFYEWTGLDGFNIRWKWLMAHPVDFTVRWDRHNPTFAAPGWQLQSPARAAPCVPPNQWRRWLPSHSVRSPSRSARKWAPPER